ncbi:MAG: class I SAM-dependent methyltransferase [Chloroflexi bacterium]|nr:class I SAM-dependent methyltransferase [Chloroflexota bacterium]
MSVDDRFEDLLDALAGFYRSWLIYLGLELGLMRQLHDATSGGLTTDELAQRSGCARVPVQGWCRAAYAYNLLEANQPGSESARFSIDAELAAVLLDEERPEYLGGQFLFTVGASQDYGRMLDFFRTGEPLRQRSASFHRFVEKLNTQDIAVFFEQALPELTELRQRLQRAGAAALDVACGGGLWLLAAARTFPELRLQGLDFEPELIERAQGRLAEAGLSDRIMIEPGDPSRDLPAGPFALVYIQDILHELPEPTVVLGSAWSRVEPGGMLVVLDWCIPDDWIEYRTPFGELIWGYQLDELYQGTSLLTRSEFKRLFEKAGIGTPELLELEAGASLFLARREG